MAMLGNYLQQTTFSDAFFVSALKVNIDSSEYFELSGFEC